MTPLYQDDAVRLYVGDWREVLPQIEEPIDAVITDPPYSERTHVRKTLLVGECNPHYRDEGADE